MCIRTTTVHIPLEDKTSSFSNDNIDIDNDMASVTTNTSAHQDNPHHLDLVPDHIQIPETPPPLRNQIQSTLQSWIIPGNAPRIPPLPTHQAPKTWPHHQLNETATINNLSNQKLTMTIGGIMCPPPNP